MVAEFFLENTEEFLFDYEIDSSKENFTIGMKILNYKEKPTKYYRILDIINVLYSKNLTILVEEVEALSIDLMAKRITKEQEIELEKCCISNVLVIDYKGCIKWALDTLKSQKSIPFSNLRSNEKKYFDVIKNKVIEGVHLKENEWKNKEQKDLENGGLPVPSLDHGIAKGVK
jgi:hypothetical protein